ncbi:MAG TPA: DNA recombination protein RmuC [Bacilli bacterium]|nr:DNA recombination protein RmuC [Bacilli bacterium]
MDTTVLILSIISLTLVVISLILLVVLVTRSHKEEIAKGYDDSTLRGEMMGKFGEIRQNIADLKGKTTKDIHDALNEEMIKVLQQNIKNSEEGNAKLERFQQNITESLDKKMGLLTERVDLALKDINKRVDERLDAGFKSTTDNVSKMVESLTKIEEARKKVEELSTQVVTLSSILSNNQKRGQFGEFTLNRILENVFGETRDLYKTQYELKIPSRETVRPDAVIFLPEPNKLVCIDSKFPFSQYEKVYDGSGSKEEIASFKRDVKNQIRDVASKYIVLGYTSREALMFIPSDGIYAYINVNFPDLVDEAQRQNVVLTSPSTLQPMLASIHGLIIEYRRAEKLEELNRALVSLGQEFSRFTLRWDKLTQSIKTVSKSQEELDKTVTKISHKFNKINAGISEDSALETSGQSETIEE